jgi:hypothetical protein
MNSVDTKPVPREDESEIDLVQIFDFISRNWKRMALGAVAGAVLGVVGWMFMAKFEAESVLINNGTLNFMSWRGLQKNLPILASQILETKQVKPGQENMYKLMSDPKWFSLNVVPTYSLTKADTKDLATISKELQESGGTNILNLVVHAKGYSKEVAINNVELVTGFVKQGSAYLSLKSLINGYESTAQNSDSELQKKILDAEVELKFMRERATHLEAMRQRFPQNITVSGQQIMDLKDPNAKFMPISTQLVAINTDINNALESLQRMRDSMQQVKVMRDFVAKAQPLMVKETNGLALCDQLLGVETELRASLKPGDTNGQQMLNSIRASLVGVRTSFIKSLDTDLVPQVVKPGPVMPAIGGLFAGAFLGLLYGIGLSLLPRLRAA